MDHTRTLVFWNHQHQAEGRHRSLSAPSSGGNVSPVQYVPNIMSNVPVSHLYQNVVIPPSAKLVMKSSPPTPLLVPHLGIGPHGASASFPVFPGNAQECRTKVKKIREATLFTKNHKEPSSVPDMQPVGRKPYVAPKMHLFAGASKKDKSAPREEDFPAPPVHWLVGSSSHSISSTSETQSGSASDSEDEVESEGASSLPVMQVAAHVDTCQMLSSGLKALLKVGA